MAKSSFDELTAADLMERDVIVVAPGDTLREAMNLMTENHVTGLPVMDVHSRCVGVITASDILNYEQEHAEEAAEANADVAQHFDMDSQRWESVRVSSFALEEFGDVRVEEVMTRDLISVTRDTPVTEVAKALSKARVHRALVLGEENQLYGIISSTSFVDLFADPSGFQHKNK